jgi:hypothetical protein
MRGGFPESPSKEATAVSRDLKYIGMDVHKEAMVIAVLNGSGKQVMESIVETKASRLVQFMHGLRGELHVRERPPVTHESTGSRPVAPVLSGPCCFAARELRPASPPSDIYEI